MKKFFSFVGIVTGGIAINVLAVCILVGLLYYFPSAIVFLLDANLALVKVLCTLLPENYGFQVESALRGGLGIDKILLFAEVVLLVRIACVLIRRLFVGR